jgi:hypothetical protein
VCIVLLIEPHRPPLFLITDSDNNPRVASLPYEEASGGREINPDDDKPAGKVESEKVDNVSGSSAGAGSGDFHTYRHARNREFFRLAKIKAEAKTDELNEEVSCVPLVRFMCSICLLT